jgi:hypothetical protein
MKSLGKISIVVALCLTGSALAQAQFFQGGGRSAQPAANVDQNGEEQEPPLVVRVYDVGDLLMIDLPSYPAKRLNDLGDGRSLFSDNFEPSEQMQLPMYSAMGAHAPVNYDSASDNFDGLTDLITGTIAPTIWDGVGGSSSIRAYGHLLIISAPEKNQTEIHALLSEMRHHLNSRKTVVVETHWLWLTEEQLRHLVPNSSSVVDEKAWGEHQKQLAREDSELIPGYHATITCLNGQTVSVLAGRQRRFVISLIPVVGDNGAPATITGVGGSNARSVGYQPQSATVQEGAALQVRPILCGEDQVLLDIHGRVVEVETPEQGENPAAEQSAKKAAADGKTDIDAIAKAVDRPVVNTSRIDTTFRAPLDSRTLVGGITGSTRPEPDEPSLYLFAKVTVKLKDVQKNK